MESDLLYLYSISKTVENVPANTTTKVSFEVDLLDGYEPFISLYRTNAGSTKILPVNTSAIISNGKTEFSVLNIGDAKTNVAFYIFIIYVKKEV